MLFTCDVIIRSARVRALLRHSVINSWSRPTGLGTGSMLINIPKEMASGAGQLSLMEAHVRPHGSTAPNVCPVPTPLPTRCIIT